MGWMLVAVWLPDPPTVSLPGSPLGVRPSCCLGSKIITSERGGSAERAIEALYGSEDWLRLLGQSWRLKTPQAKHVLRIYIILIYGAYTIYIIYNKHIYIYNYIYIQYVIFSFSQPLQAPENKMPQKKHVALHRSGCSGCSGCSGHWKTGANHIKPRPNEKNTPWWSPSHGHGSKWGNPWGTLRWMIIHYTNQTSIYIYNRKNH